MKWRLMAILAFLMTVGCMSNDTVDDVDVNQDKLYGRYSGAYDANTKKLDLWTQLRVGGNGGTTVRLLEGRLSVNDREMAEHYGDVALVNLTGTYYYLKQTVDAPSLAYDVVWDRSDGEQITNAIAIPSPIRVVDAYARRAGLGYRLVIEYEGEEPINQERIEARVQARYGPLQQRRRGGIRKTVTVGREIIFSPAETVRIPWGSQIDITLTKSTRSTRVNGHNDEGGIMDGRYIAERFTVRWPN